MKLATNIQHVSGNCGDSFQGQRSKVKVICVQMCECCHGGGIYFDSATSRRTCVINVTCYSRTSSRTLLTPGASAVV